MADRPHFAATGSSADRERLVGGSEQLESWIEGLIPFIREKVLEQLGSPMIEVVPVCKVVLDVGNGANAQEELVKLQGEILLEVGTHAGSKQGRSPAVGERIGLDEDIGEDRGIGVILGGQGRHRGRQLTLGRAVGFRRCPLSERGSRGRRLDGVPKSARTSSRWA